MSRKLATALAFGLAPVLSVVLALPAGATTFSLADKSKPDPHPSQPTQLWRVRLADNGGFDRMVIDQRFSRSGYRVRYVDHVTADPSGMNVHLKGNYFLEVVIHDAGTDAAAGAPTDVHHKYTPLLPEIRQVKKTGEFEGVVSFGIGLKHKRDFRVLRLTSPRRLVIDVKH
jgi:hypothetical protein